MADLSSSVATIWKNPEEIIQEKALYKYPSKNKHNMTQMDYILNFIGAELIAQPRFKVWPLYGIKKLKLGRQVAISPGVRVHNCSFGDDIFVGINARIYNSEVGNYARIGVGAYVDGCKISDNTIIGANAIITEDIPPDTIAYGYNQTKPIQSHKYDKSKRKVKRLYYDRNPAWYWWDVGKDAGRLRFPAAVPRYFLLNHIPHYFRSNKVKIEICSALCRISKKAKISYSAIIDPIYPDIIQIEDDVTLGPESVIITHSFIGMKKYTFEYGFVKILEGAKLGYHTAITPGVTIPQDTEIPKWGVATANGVWLVLENERVSYEDLKI